MEPAFPRPVGRWWIALLLSISLGGLGGCDSRQPVLGHEVYVWQRVWKPAVEAAIQHSKKHFQSYVVLAGEIDWISGQPGLTRTRIDYPALRRCEVRTGLALRIGSFPGPFRADDSIAHFIADGVRQILQEAREAGIQPVELQIDFDCAQAKLAEYRVWIGVIQLAAKGIPISITVLPSWLGEPDFRALARQAGSFVLQVHSVQMPVRPGGDPRIFDPSAAEHWMRQAEKTGVPFRVALPTYTNRVLFDAEGKITGVTSEDAVASPSGATAHLVRADAPEVAGFLNKVRVNPPRHLRGFIWYRLPLTTDRLNWRWETLQAVIEARPLLAACELQIAPGNPADLSVINTGNLDAPLPGRVSLDWADAHFIAGDALPGWTLEHTESSAIFRPAADRQEERLPPGGKMAIGWVRLDSPEIIHGQIP